jgi:hypothetical protein
VSEKLSIGKNAKKLFADAHDCSESASLADDADLYSPDSNVSLRKNKCKKPHKWDFLSQKVQATAHFGQVSEIPAAPSPTITATLQAGPKHPAA